MNIKGFLILLIINSSLSAAEDGEYTTDNTATLLLSSNTDNIVVKEYSDRFCMPPSDESLITRLENKNNFNNPISKLIKLNKKSEFVVTFLHFKNSYVNQDFCPITIRFKTVKNKKYHVHYNYTDGICKIKLLTYIENNEYRQEWKIHPYVINDNLCLETEDWKLIKIDLPIRRKK